MALSRRIKWSASGLAVIALIAAVAAVMRPPGAGLEAGGAAPNVAHGETVYAENCASCHGADLAGQANWRTRLPSGRLPAPPHDETGHTWHHGDEILFGITKYGPGPFAGLDGYESDMPGFETLLSDDDIRAALAFIKNAWPPEIRARQEQLNR